MSVCIGNSIAERSISSPWKNRKRNEYGRTVQISSSYSQILCVHVLYIGSIIKVRPRRSRHQQSPESSETC